MQLDRRSWTMVALAIFVVLMWLRSGAGPSTIQDDPVLGQSGIMSFVTFFSTKNPNQPQNANGYWSVYKDASGKRSVVPGIVPKASAQLLYAAFDRAKLAISADSFYDAGLLEGFTSSSQIQSLLKMLPDHYTKIAEAWFKLTGARIANLRELTQFFDMQIHTLLAKPKTLSADSIEPVMQHLQGILDGYNMRFEQQIKSAKMQPLQLSDLFFINSYTELIDIGAYIKSEKVRFNPAGDQTALAKRIGAKSALLAQFILNNRAQAALLELSASRPTNARNLSEIKSSWENHAWYPEGIGRSYVRLSLPADNPTYGYQHIPLPGQIVTTDSFLFSLAHTELSSSLIRKIEFLTSSPPPPVSLNTAKQTTDKDQSTTVDDSKNGDGAAKPRASKYLTAWLLAAIAFHTPNITHQEYIQLWQEHSQDLVSENYKLLIASKETLVEWETSPIRPAELHDHAPGLLKYGFWLSTSASTNLAKDEIDPSAVAGYEKYESGQSASNLDAYSHKAVWRAHEDHSFSLHDALKEGNYDAFEKALSQLSRHFGLYYHRTLEFMERNAHS